MLIRNTNAWKTIQTKMCLVFTSTLCHNTVVSFDPFLCVDATRYFLLISPSFPFPSWLLFPDRLFGLTFSNTWIHANELDSNLVKERTKQPKAACWECSSVLELHGTKELLSPRALMGQLAKSHHHLFVPSSDTWLNSRVSPEPKLLVTLCCVIG